MHITKALRAGGMACAILFLVAGTGGARAQTASSNAPGDDALFPTQGAPAAARKTIDFRRIVMRIPTQQAVGATYYDLLCISNSRPVYVKRSGDWDAREYRPLFADALAAAGYATPGTGDSLFKEADTAEPNLLVAAAITGLNIKTCMQPSIGGLGRGRGHTTATATFEWQVFDPLERKVVFTATTQGHGVIDDYIETSDLASVRSAFADAAKALTRMPEFQAAAAAAPEGATDSANDDAMPNVVPVVIPAVALSSKPLTQSLDDLKAHVVTIITARGTGSGFYIADTLLLTNHHVAAQGNMVKIRFGTGREIPGQVLVSNAHRDIALIRTESIGLAGLPLQLTAPDIGNKVYVLGSPGGQEFDETLSSGIVSAIRDLDHKPFIQSDVGVTHGNSGGPMFDEHGNVIGVTDLGISVQGEVSQIKLFIPIADALRPLGITVDASSTQKVASKGGSKHAAAH